MTEQSKLIETIVNRVADCDQFDVVQPVKVGETALQNELLLFVKPEIFLVDGQEAMKNTLHLVFDRLAEFEVTVSGVMIVGGQVLERLEIMNRHYGFINRLSRFASQMLDDEDRRKIASALGLPSLEGYRLLGGHEFLRAYPDEDSRSLDALWFTKKSVKIRSGFYVQAYAKDGEAIVLVNGFHPLQLEHYTDPTHRIVLMLLHASTDWAALRNEMVGATFPEKAVPHSIRGTLYAQPSRFGLESVSIANNGVHLSAGPFEGMFEIMNFLGNILGLDAREHPPLLLKKMLAAGLTFEEAMGSLENPVVIEEPKPVDLFTATEDMNSDEAIAFWLAHR